MKKYVFRPYDINFPKLFEKERERIRKVLGKSDLIEHIGSTAVPSLGGKGIIDICIATDKKNLKVISKKLQKLVMNLVLKVGLRNGYSIKFY
ncbi:GrpB family protein [Patescibacteria group bacterium]|nr:GrpB family protein [Patescibacteria group bacterium]